MRPGCNCLGNMFLRILVGSLVAVVLGALLACGQSEDVGPVEARMPTPESFDLLESAFHQSTVLATLGDRVEVSVEVRQEKHDRHICGVPSVVDPFSNVLQTLSPQQNAAKGTAGHYFYESRYAFFAATEGEYGLKLENRGCLIDVVAAVATVRWAIHPAQELSQ